MIILAHRGNFHKKDETKENSFELISQAIDNGFGIEMDIRKQQDNSFYLSHDLFKKTSDNAAKNILQMIQNKNPHAYVALNIKEIGHEKTLVTFLENYYLPNMFLFDFELIEDEQGSTAKLIKSLNNSIRVAARVSDRNEPIERAFNKTLADYVWLDEFDSFWVTRENIKVLKDTGKKIFAISPELHGYTLEIAQRRWRNFIDWGVDGICTDYCSLLRKTYEEEGGYGT